MLCSYGHTCVLHACLLVRICTQADTVCLPRHHKHVLLLLSHFALSSFVPEFLEETRTEPGESIKSAEFIDSKRVLCQM